MTKLQSVLLVESDAAVVADVVASLRLVSIPVMVAHGEAELEKLLAEVRPGMIIVRATIAGKATAGAEIVVRLAARSDLNGLPIVALLKHSERAAMESCFPVCRGQIFLPVEFPAFTYKVQEFFVPVSQAEVHKQALAKEIQSGTGADEKAQKKKGKGGAPSSKSGRVDEKLLTAYSIQLLALESLQSNPAFTGASPDEVPRILAEITNKICLSYRAG